MNGFFRIVLCFAFILPLPRAFAIQPTVPLGTDFNYRISLGPQIRVDAIGMNRAELYFDFAQIIGSGFEWGFSAHSGAAAKQLFISDKTAALLGFDLMGRFYSSLTPYFYVGLQFEVGYVHNMIEISKAGAAGFRFSVPFTSYFENVISISFVPAIHYEGQIVDSSVAAASSFGHSLGASIGILGVVYTSGPGILFAIQPGVVDVREAASFNMDLAAGVVFDF